MDELIIKRQRPVVVVDTRTPEELATFKSVRLPRLPVKSAAAPRKAKAASPVAAKGLFKGKSKK